MEAKTRMNITLPTRLKRRLKAIADDKDMSMNDVMILSLNNLIDRLDGEYRNPDLISERLTEILNSQLRVVHDLNHTNEHLANLESQLDLTSGKDNHE